MKTKRIYWTDDMIRDVALKYESRAKFFKANNAAYYAAQRRGILNDACEHMKAHTLY